MNKIYLRLLEESDAAISWKWRNDPEIWKYTGSAPDKPVTYELELAWIKMVLTREDQLRFAICEKRTDRYIGNAQLTAINVYDAEFHIFIGDKLSWGNGYASEATKLLLEYGFETIHLQSIYLDVKKENIGAIKAYKNAGFLDVFEYDHYRRMAVYKMDQISKKLSVFVMTYNHEKFIAQALEGMLMQQTKFIFEIVVGDDFSSDMTRSILLDFSAKHPKRIKLLFYPYNVTAAINQIWVLKNCKGKFIAMCEGDDYWTDPYKLQKQVDFLDANANLVGCFSDTLYISEQYQNGGEALTDQFKKEISINEVGSFWMPTVSVMFHTSVVKRTIESKGFSKVNNGDMFLYYIAAQYGNFGYVETLPSIYRQHIGGVWSSLKVNEQYGKNLFSDFIIFDSLRRENKKYALSRITDNVDWHLEHYKKSEHISILMGFYLRNAMKFLNRFLLKDFFRLTAKTFPVFLQRVKDRLDRVSR